MYKTVQIKVLQKSVLRDCISMCFDICTITIRVSIRVRGLHLVFDGLRPPTSFDVTTDGNGDGSVAPSWAMSETIQVATKIKKSWCMNIYIYI